MARWVYVVCGTTGVPIGEPEATGRTLSIGVSRTATAGFTVRAGSRLWSAIAAGDTTLKVYDGNGDLVFYGDIVSDELVASGQGGTVQIQAADLSFRLSKRYVGKDVTGIGTQWTATDPATIVSSSLATVNGEQATGVTIGATGAFVNRTITVLWTKLLDLIAELGSVADSFEWRLSYVDGTPPTVTLDLLALLGSDRTTTVFLEYGIGRNNCADYRRVRTLDTVATRVYALGSGSTITALAYDGGAEVTRRFEDVLSFGDIPDAALLDALASAHVAIRRAPRRTVNMTPFPANAPRFGIDWFIGDYITARGTVEGVTDTNGTARIWAADVTINESGEESASITLEPSS